MVKPLIIKKHDRQPYYFAEVKDSTGDLKILDGCMIYCTMKNAVTGVVKISRQSAGIVVLDQIAYRGKFYYAWQSGDTDTAGKYYIEFEIVPEAGGKFTVPVDNSAVVIIRDSLDTQ